MGHFVVIVFEYQPSNVGVYLLEKTDIDKTMFMTFNAWLFFG